MRLRTEQRVGSRASRLLRLRTGGAGTRCTSGGRDAPHARPPAARSCGGPACGHT